jgi:hypothetical protein
MTKYEQNFQGNLTFSGSLNNQLIGTIEELLDEMPFSDEIRKWLTNHTEVRAALKAIVRDRFVPIRAITIVFDPPLEGIKESVGIYSIDRKQNNKIKQDYLMQGEDGTFVLFTGTTKGMNTGKYVQHVNAIESRYGSSGKSFLADHPHHPTLEDVPDAIRPYIEEVLSSGSPVGFFTWAKTKLRY